MKKRWVVRLPDGFVAYRTDEGEEAAKARLTLIKKNFPGAVVEEEKAA